MCALKNFTVRTDFVHEWRCAKLSLKNDPMYTIVLLIKKALITKLCQVEDIYVWNGMCWMHI